MIDNLLSILKKVMANEHSVPSSFAAFTTSMRWAEVGKHCRVLVLRHKSNSQQL